MVVFSFRICICRLWILFVLLFFFLLCFVFFFFKQKTAYEMRISDWSSDVCSSDLVAQLLFVKRVANKRQHDADGRLDIAKACQRSDVLPRKGGPALWQVQSAVRRQPRQRCALKIQRRRAAPGADVMHDALR